MWTACVSSTVTDPDRPRFLLAGVEKAHQRVKENSGNRARDQCSHHPKNEGVLPACPKLARIVSAASPAQSPDFSGAGGWNELSRWPSQDPPPPGASLFPSFSNRLGGLLGAGSASGSFGFSQPAGPRRWRRGKGRGTHAGPAPSLPHAASAPSAPPGRACSLRLAPGGRGPLPAPDWPPPAARANQRPASGAPPCLQDTQVLRGLQPAGC